MVTLSDFRSVHQGSPDTPTDISEGISLNSVANLVTLTATITDGDGDHHGNHRPWQAAELPGRRSEHPFVVPDEEQQLPFLVVDESFLTAATNGVDGRLRIYANTTAQTSARHLRPCRAQMGRGCLSPGDCGQRHAVEPD